MLGVEVPVRVWIYTFASAAVFKIYEFTRRIRPLCECFAGIVIRCRKNAWRAPTPMRRYLSSSLRLSAAEPEQKSQFE